jgi:hypothetical protein
MRARYPIDTVSRPYGYKETETETKTEKKTREKEKEENREKRLKKETAELRPCPKPMTSEDSCLGVQQ